MNIILPDRLGDWRLETVLVIRGDHVLPSGFKAKDGTHMWKTTCTRDRNLGAVGFPTPQQVSLFLDAALSSAIQGRALRRQIAFPKVMADGSHQAEGEHVPPLYEFFESCMVACVFSYFAVEVFANQTIWEKVDKPIEVDRKGKKKILSADDLQRKLSTDEKIEQVLPSIFKQTGKMPSQAWSNYSWLKSTRDSIVHLKSRDHYVRWKEDEDSVYHTFLNSDPVKFPQAAIGVLRYFVKPGSMRWLDAAEDYLKGATTA